MRALLLASVLLCPATAATAQDAAAPKGRCVFQFDNTPNTSLSLTKLPSGQYNTYLGRGVVARCPAQHIILRSDSLESYGDEGRLYFVGHVDYTEPRLKLKSDFLTYFQKEERFLSTMNVDATLPSGSRLRGPSLEYFRAVPKVRTVQRAVAVGRPTIAVVDKDPKGKAQPPVNVTGNTVWLEGDSVVSSQGDVVVVRPELTATGDSIYLDGGKGLLRIMRKPKILGTKNRPFTLVGETIDLLSRQRKLERVLAKSSAEAISEDLHLSSDTIDLRVANDLLQRAVTWGKSRAHAYSASQTIVSDSIDVFMPDQRVREMHAIRKAVAEGAPDTTHFRTKERDRLTGDTVIAYFDSIPAKDTAAKTRIRQLVAIGNATSLQHLAAQDSSCHLPAQNYVRGRLITVKFDSARVKDVVIEGKDKETSDAVYVEPDNTCGHGKTAADTSKVSNDPRRPTAPAVPPRPQTSPPVAKPEDRS